MDSTKMRACRSRPSLSRQTERMVSFSRKFREAALMVIPPQGGIGHLIRAIAVPVIWLSSKQAWIKKPEPLPELRLDEFNVYQASQL